jgi:hypothetical protein
MNKEILQTLIDKAISRSRQPKPVKKIEIKTYKDFGLKSPYKWDTAGVFITYANGARKWYVLFDYPKNEFCFGGADQFFPQDEYRKIQDQLYSLIINDRDLNMKTRLKYRVAAIKVGHDYDPNEILLQKGVYPYEDEE